MGRNEVSIEQFMSLPITLAMTKFIFYAILSRLMKTFPENKNFLFQHMEKRSGSIKATSFIIVAIVLLTSSALLLSNNYNNEHVGRSSGNITQLSHHIINLNHSPNPNLPRSITPVVNPRPTPGHVSLNQIEDIHSKDLSNLSVSPTYGYSSEPAPMGIADYGLSAPGLFGYSSYEYRTPSFKGKVLINSLSTYNSDLGGNPACMTFQLNVNLAFSDGGTCYVYWIQDVAFVNTESPQFISFIDNVWNFSAQGAIMHPTSISGNGSLSLSGSNCYYYSYADPSLLGNDVSISFPTTIQLQVVSEINANNQPEVVFEYNDGYGWVTYDDVFFKFVNNLSDDLGFVVNGSTLNPAGFYYDAELIMGGPGGGTKTTNIQSNVQLSLEYWNGNNFQDISNAFNYGSDTAEGINGTVSTGNYNSICGMSYACATNGNGALEEIYDSQELGWINLVSNIPNGIAYIGIESHYFSCGSANFTVGPGTYSINIFTAQGTGILVWSGTVTVTAGRASVISIPPVYSLTLSETGLPVGKNWSATIQSNTLTSNTSTLCFLLPNGQYTFDIKGTAGYKANVYSGKVNIDNGNQKVVIRWTVVTYKVTFKQVGLPDGESWYLKLSNGTVFQVINSSFSFNVPNGTYNYSVGTSDKTYEPASITGNFSIGGAPIEVSIQFNSVKYSVDFIASGLPSGSEWWVNLSNGKSFNSQSSSIVLFEVNGTYTYKIATSDKSYRADGGDLAINGANSTERVVFIEVKYSITFEESGLPSGSDWYLNITGVVSSGPISSSTYTVGLINGTYSYSVTTTSKGYQFTGNSFSVNGNSVTVNLSFSESLISILTSGVVLYVMITTVVVVIGASLVFLRKKK